MIIVTMRHIPIRETIIATNTGTAAALNNRNKKVILIAQLK